jgi:hypothetical protein
MSAKDGFRDARSLTSAEGRALERPMQSKISLARQERGRMHGETTSDKGQDLSVGNMEAEGIAVEGKRCLVARAHVQRTGSCLVIRHHVIERAAHQSAGQRPRNGEQRVGRWGTEERERPTAYGASDSERLDKLLHLDSLVRHGRPQIRAHQGNVRVSGACAHSTAEGPTGQARVHAGPQHMCTPSIPPTKFGAWGRKD